MGLRSKENRRTFTTLAFLVLATTFIWLGPASEAAAADRFTDTFRLQDCRWGAIGGNAFFKLRPGWFLRLEGDDDGEFIEVEITVLRETERISMEIGGVARSIRTRVVEEAEWIDGEIVEISRNYFAECKETGDVFYFGEEVDNYEDGEVDNHDGSWRAGEDGAMPGIIMPGTFLKGARYYQEIAPANDALDRGTNVDMDLTIDTPAGTFTGCVAVVDTTPLEPGAEDLKLFCPGLGLVGDAAIELVEYGFVNR